MLKADAPEYRLNLYAIEPEDRRPTYLGLMNTTMGISAAFPALGGVLADLVSVPLVFALTLATSVAGCVLTGALRDAIHEASD